jgi:hypothetical protein
MPLDEKQLAQAAIDLKRDVLEDIAGDAAAPACTLEMARILLESPWVQDFLMPLVSPVRSNVRALLKMSVIRVQDRVWYFPSYHWWRAHARLFHGPDGSGCDFQAHVKYLSDDPSTIQANLLKDGTVHRLTEEDLRMETDYWKANQARFTGLPEVDKKRI